MNENTTTRAAIESRAQKQTRRTAQAHARHAAPEYAPMTATAGEHATICPALHDMTPAALYYLPELCAAFVLRARERETGLKLFSELTAAARRDREIMHHRAERAERAAESRAEYEEARAFAAELDGVPADGEDALNITIHLNYKKAKKDTIMTYDAELGKYAWSQYGKVMQDQISG